MKLKNIFSITKNKKNYQTNFSLRKKKFEKIFPGMKPEDLMEINFLKPKIKFYKK
jgi:hypothetical protein